MKVPTGIALHTKSQELELTYDDGRSVRLPVEFLRVFSPSAEVKGHAPGQEILQVGKKGVELTLVEPMGNYAIKLAFSDGHDSGIYSWDYLEHLVENRETLWEDYLKKLEQAGASREPDPKAAVAKKGGCGGGHGGNTCGCKH